jgi:hypothetical protein
MKLKLFFLTMLAVLTLSTIAQETDSTKCNLSMGADLASMYLWRGFPQGTGPAIQPWGEFSYKGFTLGTWGSYEFKGEFKEVDVYAKYTYKDFSLVFVDLFFPDYPGLDPDFYNFNNKTTGHASELALSFNGSSKIPFSVSGGVILYGTPIDPKPTDTASINHSTYFEINYLGNIKDYSYTAFLGFTPTSSTFYGTEKFSVFNVGLSATKALKVTDDFSVPIKLTLATNPLSKKIYMALLLSLK